MSGSDLNQIERREALMVLVRSLGRMKKTPQNVMAQSQAARRLKVTRKRLRLMIALDLVDTVRIGKRDLVILL